jgi:pimeloyl-ACP methyl ester carboxylesterase
MNAPATELRDLPITQRRVVSDRSIRYRHVRPKGPLRSDLVLVAVHGISRNADEHAAALARLAQRLGCHLVAPLFGRQRFNDYQQLGLSADGVRADLALQLILADLTRHGLDSDARIILTGFSGGAQFAHRYALAHPQRIAALLIAAAGWYCEPDSTVPWPLGCGDGQGAPRELHPDALLALPTLVVVGECDDVRDRALRRDPVLDSMQGQTRLARARNWVAGLQRRAACAGLPPRCQLRILPKASHDFVEMVAAGLPRAYADFLEDLGISMTTRLPRE